MDKITELHLANKHSGQSDVFLKEDSSNNKSLIKQYPAFTVEQIRLYHAIQNYLSKFSMWYNENKKANRKIYGLPLKSAIVNVLPLDPNNITLIKPYNTARNIETLITSSFPEYVSGPTMHSLCEINDMSLIFARRMCWSIETNLRNIIAPWNYWSIHRITIDPLNVKVKSLGNWVFEFIVTDIAADMLQMLYGTYEYSTRLDVDHLKETIESTIFTLLSERNHIAI